MYIYLYIYKQVHVQMYMALEASRAVLMIVAHDFGHSITDRTGKAKVSYYLQRCSGASTQPAILEAG